MNGYTKSYVGYLTKKDIGTFSVNVPIRLTKICIDDDGTRIRVGNYLARKINTNQLILVSSTERSGTYFVKQSSLVGAVEIDLSAGKHE